MFIGIDPSLNSTGFVYSDADGEIHSGRIIPTKLRGLPRLDFCRESILNVLQSVMLYHGSIKLIAYEDYAMGGKTDRGRLFDIGEFGGVVKYTIWQAGIDLLMVPPSNLKLFATGRGTTRGPNKVEKRDIINAVAENWGYNVPDDDEADAFILYQMAKDYGSSRMRAGHRKNALASCSIVKGKAVNGLQAIAKRPGGQKNS